MNTKITPEIIKANEEISALTKKIEEQKKLLSSLISSKYEQEKNIFPLSNFIHNAYLFDKPQKWNSPKIKSLTEEDIEDYSYMSFNGIYTGKQLLSLYEFNSEKIDFLQNETNYVIFALPDEDYYEQPHFFSSKETADKKDKTYVPLVNVWKILIFKI